LQAAHPLTALIATPTHSERYPVGLRWVDAADAPPRTSCAGLAGPDDGQPGLTLGPVRARTCDAPLPLRIQAPVTLSQVRRTRRHATCWSVIRRPSVGNAVSLLRNQAVRRRGEPFVKRGRHRHSQRQHPPTRDGHQSRSFRCRCVWHARRPLLADARLHPRSIMTARDYYQLGGPCPPGQSARRKHGHGRCIGATS